MLLNDRFKEIGYESNIPGILLCEVRFGSHLYGLSGPTSDEDFKGIYLPTVKNMVLLEYPATIKTSSGNPDEKNKPGDIDREYISLHKFIKLACDGDTLAIDMLHADGDNLLYTSDIWDYLVSNRTMFYTKNLKALVGYCRHQAAKYGVKGSRVAAIRDVLTVLNTFKYYHDDCKKYDLYQVWNELYQLTSSDYISFQTCDKSDKIFIDICGKKYENKAKIEYVIDSLQKQLNAAGERALLAEKNEGIDWKALSHALRVGYQAYHIYKDGDFSYPLKENKLILDTKRGNIPFAEVSEILEKLIEDVNTEAEKSSYPIESNIEFWKEWLWTVVWDSAITE